ncbi:ATP10 protein-domain-containing protein [Podospora appendiculata]|uniref:ATP10 protein-domain-containing protein n=1 Tax=Podospora appendiculata TaxID=314037 RepID=A0AAE0XIE0_9PEZI|nr:ATP10 protein-domain-containing protein [Podospora appendiculata]
MITRTNARAASCLACQWRSFSVSYRRFAAEKPSPSPSTPPAPPSSSESKTPPAPKAIEAGSSTADAAKQTLPAKPAGPLAHAPRAYGDKLEEFTPTPLWRPIGMNAPPSAGENTGIDHRTLKQRRDDFVDYDKHIARRQELKSKMARPYFRDWRNMQFHKGKTFLSPPRPFKADLSLYFPNLHGRTLDRATPASKAADTTPVLQGRASVVTVFSSMWAENQVKSFTDAARNPALHALLGASGGRAQLVQVNVEEDTLKAWLIRLFEFSLRRRIAKPDWGKYFLVRRGITDEIRESIGLLNSKVGYTYLVDHQCRIRWAGSGLAEPKERESLVKGVQRVLDEMAKENVGQTLVRKPVVKGGGAKAGGVSV